MSSANLIKKTTKIKKMVEVEQEKTIIEGIELKLSMEEAAALFCLVGETNSTNYFIGQACRSIFTTLNKLGFELNNKEGIDRDVIDTKNYFGQLNFHNVKCPNE